MEIGKKKKVWAEPEPIKMPEIVPIREPVRVS